MKILLVIITAFLFMPCSAQDYLKIGDECYSQKNYTCAYDNYMKAQEAGLNAKKDILYFRIGYCLNKMKRYEEAKRWLWRAIAENTSLDPVWDLASAHLNLKKYDSSAFYYAKALSLATSTENKKSISYWAGASHFNLKDYAKAKTYLLECVKYDSTYIPSLLLLGRTYVLLYDYKSAETSFTKALQYTKDSSTLSDIYMKFGEMYYGQKKYEEAVGYYRQALFYDKWSSDPLTSLGDAYKNSNKPDSALYYYQKAIDFEQSLKADADSIRMGNIYIAMLYTKFGAKDTVKGLSYLPLGIKYNPLHISIRNAMEILFRLKDIKTMETILPPYTKALKENKQEEAAARWYTMLAAYYKEAKQPQKEYLSYKTALSLAPTSKSVLTSFVNQRIVEKKVKEALDSVDKRLMTAPKQDMTDLNALKGELLFLQKDTIGSASIFRDVIKYTPYNYNANYYLGLMYLQRKDTITCLKYWNYVRGSAFDKSMPTEKTLQLHQLVAMDNFIKASSNQNQSLASTYFTTASNHFDFLLGIDSSLPVNRIYAGVANLQARKIYTGKSHLIKALNFYQMKKDTLAYIYRWLGLAEVRGETIPNYAKAIEYYEKGMQANPKDSSIIEDCGRVYYEKKEYNKAIELFGKLINVYKGSPNKAVAYYNKALCYYLNKQKPEALADLSKCLELNPKYADALKLKAELEKPTQ